MAHKSSRFSIFNVFPLLAVLMLFFGTQATAQTQNWTLIWSDDFAGPAGSAPNPNNWTLQQGLTSDGAQSYNCLYGQSTNGCNPSNPNVYLDGNNHLIIKALSAAGAPNGVTSGRIFTSNAANTSFLFSTQYGRIEAQMVLPAGSGNQGVWPAFWMLGTNIASVNWPSCGEMDIMEYIGAANPTQIYSTLHGQAYANTGLGVRDTLSSGWGGTHTFGAIWSPNQISFYVDSITNIIGTLTPADIMANQSWDTGGLAAWPFNNPMFIILDLNMGGPFPGNVSSATTYPQVLQVNYVNVYQATAPAPPTGVTATASSQSQVALSWTGSTSSDVTYNIYRSQVSGVAPLSQAQPNPATFPQTNQTLIANNITATTYTDANLSPGQTYYYTVTASGEYSGESEASQVKVTTPASGVGSNAGAIYVSAAGYSGTGAYIANSLVSGGFTNAFTSTMTTSGVTNPAPQDVYHTERWGPQTWTIAHLTPGGSYNVRMHFAESAWTAAGQRQFNVLINGQQVLTNFDIYATAGAQNTVITHTTNTVADRNGVIYLQLAVGAADQPEIRALDVTPSTGGVAYGEAAGITTYVAIDSGGAGGETGTQGTFEADEDAGSFGLPSNPITAGGATNTTTQTISTSGITNPAPAAVYQTERYGAFGYFFTGLAANSPYTIRLHLAEGVTNYNAAGLREFNVVVNGNQVLTNYDIYANAGAINQAVIPQVTGVSDEHGILSVQFKTGYDDLPSVRGIEVIQSSTPTAATPTFSPVAGTYTGTQTVTISDATSGATIYYTTNGSTPTTSSSVYSGPITVSASETIEAIAFANGYSNSAVASAAYTINSASGGTDVLDISAGGTGSGSYVADKDFSGGTAASTTAAINTSKVTNPAPQAVYQAQRYGNFTYTLPGFTAGSTYLVRLHFDEFYWTAAGKRTFNVLINGTQVLTNFDVFATAGGEDIAVAEQFNAVANSSGQIVLQFVSVVDNAEINGIEIETVQTVQTAIPTFSPAGGTYTSGQSVTVSDATSGAKIYYTTNGTTPTTSSALYSSPITVSTSETIEAIAVAAGDSTSTVAEAAYTISGPAEGPYGGTAAAIPGTIKAENYDTGGQGVGYNVTSVNGTDNSYRSDGVDLETTSATGGGNDIGWTAAGQWFRYTVNVATAGTYTVTFDVAAPSAVIDGFHLSNSAGTNLSGSVNVPATGGWQTWSTVTASVTLPAGQQVLTLNQDNGGWNIYSAAFVLTSASGGTDVLDISAGGTGSGSYVADEDYSGGSTSSTAATINTSKVTNPAPQAVYQFQRFGNFTYTLPGFTAGGTYLVRLHFDEFYWTAAGKRTFNVLINGTQVLTNFDIFATAGGEDIAVAEQFNAVANSSGQIVLQFVSVVDNAEINGIEIETSGGSTGPTAPAPPTGLSATVASSSQINLSWTASTTSGVQYEVFQNGILIATMSGTTYSSTGLTASTTYSYTVEATNSAGTSAAAGPVSATTSAGVTGATAPPTSVTAVGSSSRQIDLRWVASTTPAANTAPVNYSIYRSTTPSFTPSASNLMGTTIGITNYVDSNYPATLSPMAGPGVQPSTTYYYQVVASTSAGSSTAVATSATSLPVTPSSAAPTTLTGLTAMAENANEIDLLWNSTNSGVGTVVTTYYIYRSTSSSFTPSASNQIGTTKSNWFQDELVTASTRYYYQVLANNSLGVSPSSATVSATTPALNPNLWGGAPFFDASGIPAKPAGDTLMVKFLNRTNGKYTDAQITYTATINGSTVNTSIAANPYYAMGANSAGRMYFFLNDPTSNENNTNYWDFIEFTVGTSSINMDTTRVDAFGLKIAFNLTCGDGTNVALGENEETFMEDRSVTFQRYANAAPSTPGGNFQADLVYAPYRIIEPGAAGFNAGGADQNYYANYISSIWSFNGITIPQAGPNGSGLPSNPDLSAAIFRHTAPVSGTPEFNAAGDLTNQGMWGNPASFYQQEPYDHYAQWIEAQAINMQQYAFPYNDAGGYSSDIGCSNPTTLLVAIGW